VTCSREDVAYDEAAAPRGAAVLDPDDQEAAPLREPEPLPVGELNRLAEDAEVAALDGAPLLDRPRDAPGQLSGDRERGVAC
jgi:hypothetical protein